MKRINNNISDQITFITQKKREELLGQKAFIIWFTGFSGSGKTTIAKLLELELYKQGHLSYVLDGDIIRSGLSSDLGFTEGDRIENIRRVAHVSRLFIDSGLIIIAAFICPYEKSRDFVRDLIGSKNYIEIFLDCPLDVCISRDPKGLYKKALQNEIKNFTGISSGFEKPKNPEITIETDKITPENALNIIMKYLYAKKFITDIKRNQTFQQKRLAKS